MQYKAIIFDLFGTIVNNFSLPVHKKLISRISSILSLLTNRFSQMWHETSKQRGTGIFKIIEECLIYICNLLNTEVNDDKIKECVQLQLESTKCSGSKIFRIVFILRIIQHLLNWFYSPLSNFRGDFNFKSFIIQVL